MNLSSIKSLLIVILLSIVTYLGIQKRYPHISPEVNNNRGSVACTEEAMICPDGTFVARQGPHCTFTPCPISGENSIQTGRETITVSGVTFQYPKTLHTTYITTENRPPTITITSGHIDCISLPLHTINNRQYCIQNTNEGAAGSVYITNTYSTFLSIENKTVVISFTIRAVQCDNYDDPQKSACIQERETFDGDKIVDSIVESTISDK